AVNLLIKYDYAYTQVMRELGYPNSRTTLTKWNKEIKETGKLKDKVQKGKDAKPTDKTINQILGKRPTRKKYPVNIIFDGEIEQNIR
ncbi:MAG: hypothetical protein GX769_02225, partial [Erysipelothrix sp.]|nr:hypothetical protein [Erysipelothrix sp.]